MIAIYILQESVTIPETIDGVRACMEMYTDHIEAVGLINKCLDFQ